MASKRGDWVVCWLSFLDLLVPLFLSFGYQFITCLFSGRPILRQVLGIRITQSKNSFFFKYLLTKIHKGAYTQTIFLIYSLINKNTQNIIWKLEFLQRIRSASYLTKEFSNSKLRLWWRLRKVALVSSTRNELRNACPLWRFISDVNTFEITL